MAILDFLKGSKDTEPVDFTLSDYSHSNFGVIGLNNGAGASTTAVSLAISLARQNKKVLLLDADIFQPSLYFFFSGLVIPSEKSFIRYLAKETKETDISIKVPGYDNLWLTTVSPQDQLENLLSANVEQYRLMLKYIVDTFDFVIARVPYQPYSTLFYETVQAMDRSFMVWDEQNDSAIKAQSVVNHFRNFSANAGHMNRVVINKRTKSPFDYDKIDELNCKLLAEIPLQKVAPKAKDSGENLLAYSGVSREYLAAIKQLSDNLLN
ncbi:AAA family ATPase [Paenibacillus pabuli]|uniref:nucleotide-binding protein n=1 Tax=Paenibacillus pabuli TaxID=1472 RepID=UPI0032427C61